MKPQYINRTLTPPEKVMPEDQTESTLNWVKRGFKPDEVFDQRTLIDWAHANNYLSMEEFLEWYHCNQHMTLEDYCKSLNK